MAKNIFDYKDLPDDELEDKKKEFTEIKKVVDEKDTSEKGQRFSEKLAYRIEVISDILSGRK